MSCTPFMSLSQFLPFPTYWTYRKGDEFRADVDNNSRLSTQISPAVRCNQTTEGVVMTGKYKSLLEMLLRDLIDEGYFYLWFLVRKLSTFLFFQATWKRIVHFWLHHIERVILRRSEYRRALIQIFRVFSFT